jgi:hypothetical protein
MDVSPRLLFEAWQEIAGHSLLYFANHLQAGAPAFARFPTDLLSCDSISSLIGYVFRIYAADSSLRDNVNYFLRCFPIAMICNFTDELNGILSFIYLLQSSIDCQSRENPILENILVYRGVREASDLVMLYESTIGSVVVWSEFTKASTDRDSVLSDLMTDEDCVLFEIELHPGDVAVEIEGYSEHESGDEVLIAASTGFIVVSVDDLEVSICGEDVIRLPTVRLSYFLHWYDFDLDERPRPVLV